MSSSRSTKRCAAAAAGFGMVLASFAGAAASATAATHHSPTHASRHITPDITPPTAGVTATVGTAADIPLLTAQAGTATTLPDVTVDDPGLIATTNIVTLGLAYSPTDIGLTTAVPTVTATGTGVTVSAATVDTGAGTVKFTVTKTTPGTPATYIVSGIAVSGTSGSHDLGPIGIGVEVGTTIAPTSVVALQPQVYGAVTAIIPAAYGETAPDTAAVLFRATATGSPTSVVLASDYEPQDAESAAYLASAMLGSATGILLTDPTTLSPAVSSVLSDKPSIQTIYIVGGTSVVSAAIQSQLEAENYTVIRLAGADQYATNQFVDNYVAQNLDVQDQLVQLDYSIGQDYNDTAGTSSPTTTGVGNVKTAIVVSGGADSYQDGVVSGPLSYAKGLPVILTAPGSLSSTAHALLTEGGYKQVILLGGPDAVSDSVVSQLTASTDSGGAGVTVFRVAGTDASDTSVKFADFIGQGPEVDYFDDADNAGGGVLITRGNGFQDALAAGPYSGAVGYTPILLTENATTLGAPLTGYLKDLFGDVLAVQAIGGPLSITPAVQQAATDAEVSGLTD